MKKVILSVMLAVALAGGTAIAQTKADGNTGATQKAQTEKQCDGCKGDKACKGDKKGDKKDKGDKKVSENSVISSTTRSTESS